MAWYITIIDPARNTVLFAGNSDDETEVRAVATETRRLQPQAQIFIRPLMGKRPSDWPLPQMSHPGYRNIKNIAERPNSGQNIK